MKRDYSISYTFSRTYIDENNNKQILKEFTIYEDRFLPYKVRDTLWVNNFKYPNGNDRVKTKIINIRNVLSHWQESDATEYSFNIILEVIE
jgi:hypothetical protein